MFGLNGLEEDVERDEGGRKGFRKRIKGYLERKWRDASGDRLRKGLE